MPGIARIRGEADLAQLAGGAPVSLVHAEELVAEAGGRDPPRAANPLGEGEGRCCVELPLLELARRRKRPAHRPPSLDLGVRVGRGRWRRDRPPPGETALPAKMERVDEGCDRERPLLEALVMLALG